MSTDIVEETKNITLIERLTDIADAIRSINNTTDKYSIYDMPSKINNIDKNAIFSPQNGSLANWLTVIDLNNVDFSTVKRVNALFEGCTYLEKIFFPENFGSNVTSMSSMFSNCSSLTSLDLSNFNTQKVTYMNSMFFGCSSLTSITFPENFGSNVTSMSSMFYNCKSLTSLDLSNFDTQSVADMNNMFYTCSSLTSIDLSNWNTQSVTNMNSMFYTCSSLTTLDLSNFDTQSVTNIGDMFKDCSSLTTLNLSNFKAQSVTNMNRMFYNCSSLTTLNLSNFNAQSVTSMNRMFYNCSALTSLDLSNWNAQSVTNMNRMFYNCTSLTTLNLSNFNAQSVTSMSDTFYGCSSLTSLDLSSFNIDKVSDISRLFQNCQSLAYLDLSNLDTSNISSMNAMFSGCVSLTTLTLGNNWANNTAITKINLSDCPLTHDSCLDVFNKIADKTQTTTTSSVISINSTTKALMSDDEIKIATDKGWTMDNLQKINQNIFSEDSSCNVAFGNDKFIAADGTTLAYSVDGSNWTEVKQNVINKPGFITYVGNTFFLIGEGALAYSTNGIVWELCNLPHGIKSVSTSLCISYGNDVFVISYTTTTGKEVLCYSNNGIDWYSGTVPSSIPDDDFFMAVAFGDNMFLATSYNGFIIKSTDGITWNEVASSTDTSMNLITCFYVNDRFVLFGINSSSGEYKAFHSTDGVLLIETQALQDGPILSGVYANNMLIAGGWSLICSRDGINWKRIPQGTMDTISSITYGNGMFVLGGSDENGKSTLAYYNDSDATGPAGGYIFYKADTVQTSTYKDKDGNDVTYTWQYLEAAPEDASASSVFFGYYRLRGNSTTVQSNIDTSITKDDHSTYNGNAAVGQGRLNTSLLVNAMGSAAYSSESSGIDTTSIYAAKLCDDYTYGGYDDWFLPSIEELRYMYENLKSKSIGTWSDYYWSSTEYSKSDSWSYNFKYDNASAIVRYSKLYFVRPVRAF